MSVYRLAWIGYRTEALRASSGRTEDFSPSIFWSRPAPGSYPPWVAVTEAESPGVMEFSSEPGEGDSWIVGLARGGFQRVTTSGLATLIANGFVSLLSPPDP